MLTLKRDVTLAGVYACLVFLPILEQAVMLPARQQRAECC